ncbi:hypothetical protein TPAU25S_02968 [Tsukamurella paurometabola]|uniref:Uncharacterized protein n=1 Tax=Tsukamurella paurometabola (strain ATCC 8368 / DSM 20162 / CCUG 35730 / CIP 100753 / JCM 10117 / KCTC 9821 / NBRC 16120 / NCIMB 702349 / NCTC 13040) TaxID=521096 RepID=D5UXH1_TSUPD|nr:hypothetical protein [Tsukamurella paurometabola]ADG78063.1 hypothetical protein Tpau_1435 [Tsukamurella paurometabola DSM 20162]SUP30005.1 Uncharacterised protein [Tsukamurella paurometabola]
MKIAKYWKLIAAAVAVVVVVAAVLLLTRKSPDEQFDAKAARVNASAEVLAKVHRDSADVCSGWANRGVADKEVREALRRTAIKRWDDGKLTGPEIHYLLDTAIEVYC